VINTQKIISTIKSNQKSMFQKNEEKTTKTTKTTHKNKQTKNTRNKRALLKN
jgi:hypothetical protein